jgi:membrane protease YdiL (CAAX protease family)
MDDKPESNTDLKAASVFTAVNNYVLLVFCACCLLSSMYLQQLFAFVGQYRAGIGVSALVAMIIPIYLLLQRVGPGFFKQVRITVPRLSRIVLVILATLASVVIVDQIYLITQQFNPVPEHYVESLKDLKPVNGFTFAVIFVGLCLLVPVAEELIFRGMIQQIFAKNMGGIWGFLLAGLVFGAIHLNSHLLISISFFGIFLGFIYYATGNLHYSIIAHGVFNLVALIQLSTSVVDESDGLPFYLRDVRILVIALVLLVFFLFKIKQGGSETEPPYQSDS